MAGKDTQKIVTIIICILASFFLWIYAMGDRNPIQTRTISNIPVEIINTYSLEQSNLIILPEQSFSIDVTITGRALKVFSVEAKDFKIVADMDTFLKRGDNNIPVYIKASPEGISLVDEGRANYIRVKLDSKIEKSIKAEIKVLGTEKDGFYHLEPIIKPNEIMVSGPESYVNSVKKVTGQIDITGYNEDANVSVTVRPEDNEGNEVRNVELASKYLDAYIEIKPSKEVPIILKTQNKLPTSKILAQTKLEFEKVYIVGDEASLKKISNIQTVPVDLSKLSATEKLSVGLNIPKGVIIADKIKKIKVDFTIVNSTEKTLTIPLKLLNKNPDMDYNISEAEIQLVVKGDVETMKNVDASMCSSSIDLLNYAEGNYLMEIQVNVPEGTEVKKIIPGKVRVKIVKAITPSVETGAPTQN